MSSQRLSNYFLPPAAGGEGNELHITNSQWYIDEVAVSASAAQLNNAVAGLAANKKVIMGTHTVSAGEATAHTFTQASGLTTIDSIIVQIIRANKVSTSDATVTFSAGNFTVTDGSTYVLTSGDLVRYMIQGS
jgi:hypothetical protein